MARRRRLTPAQPEYLQDGSAGAEVKGAFPIGLNRPTPPIAQVAGDVANVAALQDLSDELRTARENGRMVQSLPLDAVVPDHLVRDRLVTDNEELQVLIESIRGRGQQTPIEVVSLANGRFGLISGWRRLEALKRLFAETGDTRFSTVLALLRKPETAADAYLAMVEENEVRVGLSYYERARIVARAAEQGVFPDEASALRTLFASASRARRSKIGSFLPIYRALDRRLNFAHAIPERLGLTLSKRLGDDPELGRRLSDRLRKASPDNAEAELAVLSRAAASDRLAASEVQQGTTPSSGASVDGNHALASVQVEETSKGLLLTGPGIDKAFRLKLEAWLRSGAKLPG